MVQSSDFMLAGNCRKDHMTSHVTKAQALPCIRVNKISHGHMMLMEGSERIPAVCWRVLLSWDKQGSGFQQEIYTKESCVDYDCWLLDMWCVTFNMCCCLMAVCAWWLFLSVTHWLISPCGLMDHYHWLICSCFIFRLSLNMFLFSYIYWSISTVFSPA